MIVFYDSGLSPFAQKVKLGLLEKGLTFERRVPDLWAPDLDFLRSSPRREVPTLVDEGFAIFDSTVILEYLDDKWPNPQLLPKAPDARARARMIEDICDTQFEAVLFGLTEIIAFKRADGDRAKTILDNGGKDIATLVTWLTGQLGQSEFFNGESFGYADIAVFPYLQTAALYRMGPPTGSPLADWLNATRVRPSVQCVIADAKAEVIGFKAAGERIQSGQWPRQYRDHRLDWMVRSGGLEIVAAGQQDGTIRFSNLPT